MLDIGQKLINKQKQQQLNLLIRQINIKKQEQAIQLKKERQQQLTPKLQMFYRRPITPIIPFKIYQAWHSDDIPESVLFCVDNIKKNNPEFEHFLFNHNMCREFIKANFSIETLDAYDSIIPNAIKIDLWRYCMLYINGGIYLDVKYYCINNFKFKCLTDKEYFCKDLENSGGGIYNALIICKPKNPIMLKSINKVIENVNNKFYGDCSLEPTGPLMIKKFFTNDEMQNIKLELKVDTKVDNTLDIYISFDNMPILFFNNKYREEQKKYQKHWAYYWIDREFYLNKTNKGHIDVFTQIYETKHWGDNNNKNYSGSSGSGSSLEQQKNTYIPFLKSFIKKNNINSVTDLGCGDFIVGKMIYNDLDVKYYGYDAYEKVINYHNKNKNNKEKDKYTFTHLDFYKEKESIVGGDLCIIKDVLMHWSLDKIYNFLDYMIEKKIFKYILILNDCLQTEDNTNIADGQFRGLSANFYPLKKYSPTILYKYEPLKEISVIKLSE